MSSSSLYGGTYNLFTHTLPKIGITTRYVDGTDPSAFGRAIDERTKAVFLELIGNPRLDVHDLASIADVAHARGVPVIVDNTFAPLLAQPIKHGADIVIHSATKWIGGHGTAIGGVVVDGGTFDWAASERFKQDFVDPIRRTTGSATRRRFGNLAFILKLRVQGLRDVGAALSPFNSFLFLQGLETLPLRITRHSENALAVARWLRGRDEVTWVSYPGLESHPSHKLAKRYLTGGFGGVVTFGVKGGAEAGRRLIDHVQLFSLLANVGDAKSLIIHPASTTHSQLEPEEQTRPGTTPDLIRLSVGLEHVDDLIADLEQALAAATADTTADGDLVGARGDAGRPSDQSAVSDQEVATQPGPAGSRPSSLGPITLTSGTTLPELTVAYRHDGPAPGRGAAGPRHPRAHRIGGRGRRLVGAAHRARAGRSTPDRSASSAPTCSAAATARPGRPRSIPGPGGRTAPAFPAVSVGRPGRGAMALARRARDRGARAGDRRFARWHGRARGRPRPTRGRSPRRCRSPRPRRSARWPSPGTTSSSSWSTISASVGCRSPAQLAMTTYRSEADFDDRFGGSVEGDGRPSIVSYLDHQGEKLVDRFDPATYRILVGAMDGHDIGRGRGGVDRRPASTGEGRRGADRRRHRGRHPVRAAPGPRAGRCGGRGRRSRRVPRDRLDQGPRRVPGRMGRS